jgi:hypothetical protein
MGAFKKYIDSTKDTESTKKENDTTDDKQLDESGNMSKEKKVEEMMKYMTEMEWSKDDKSISEACKKMHEMSKYEEGKKYLKDMDAATSKMKVESYTLGTIKPRK